MDLSLRHKVFMTNGEVTDNKILSSFPLFTPLPKSKCPDLPTYILLYFCLFWGHFSALSGAGPVSTARAWSPHELCCRFVTRRLPYAGASAERQVDHAPVKKRSHPTSALR